MSPARGDEHWTEEAIIAAIHEWVVYHGETPRAVQWTNGGGGGRPCTHTVVRRFRTWNRAMAAAGYDGRRGRAEGVPRLGI